MWSDGDDYPEQIAKWYKDQGYHFLALSDHNTLQVGERWVDVMKSGAGHPRSRNTQLRGGKTGCNSERRVVVNRSAYEL